MDDHEENPEQSFRAKDLECKRNANNECMSCADAKRGRCINYTKESPEFVELDRHDRMAYAFFMMNYNVEDRKEFAEGRADFTDVRSNISFELVKRPQKLVNILTFIAFMLIVIMFIVFILMYLVGIVGITVSPVKKQVLMWMIICLFGLILVTYIIDYVYNKAVDRVEIVGYNIK